MELAGPETMHHAHVMTELNRGYYPGSNKSMSLHAKFAGRIISWVHYPEFDREVQAVENYFC
eukprot:6468913-Amphidinium_carterae.2